MKKARIQLNCPTNVARQYIRDNYKTIKRNEIIDYLFKRGGLKERSIKIIYNEVALEFKEEKREEQRKIENSEIRYKGRKRDFFRIDDNNLYKKLMEGD